MSPETVERLGKHYARFRCLDFASAVSRGTGLAIGILRAPEAGTLGHAFLFADGKGVRETRDCLDALGTRTVARIREDFAESHGRLAWARRQVPAERSPMWTEPDEAILAIAGCLPWFHGHVDGAYVVAEPEEAERRLEALLDAIEASPRASGDWSAVEGVLEGLGLAPGRAPGPGAR